MTITTFVPTCPVCGLQLPARERASFAYVELERHLETAHRTNAVRLVPGEADRRPSPAWRDTR